MYNKIPTFKEGKIYQTTFKSEELFHLKQIIWDKHTKKILMFRGIYDKAPKLGLQFLSPDKLILKKIKPQY